MSFRSRFVRVLFAGLTTVALSTGVVLFTGCPEEPAMGPVESQEPVEPEEQMEMPEPEQEGQEQEEDEQAE